MVRRGAPPARARRQRPIESAARAVENSDADDAGVHAADAARYANPPKRLRRTVHGDVPDTEGTGSQGTAGAGSPGADRPRVRRGSVPSADPCGEEILNFDAGRIPAPLASYETGAVVFVGMRDFVAYGSCEAYPAPATNLLVRPNGTGKSTVVAALALGLGWGPPVLGRAPDIQAYVRAGSAEACVVVGLRVPPELVRPVALSVASLGRSSVRVSRVVPVPGDSLAEEIGNASDREIGNASDEETPSAEKTPNANAPLETLRQILGSLGVGVDSGILFVTRRFGTRNAFMLNGRAVQQADVLAAMGALGVRIDNLCQFLPQDRVGQFAAMSPADKLSAVLSAASPPAVLAERETLVELDERETALNAKLASSKARHASLVEQNRSVHDLVARVREREGLSSQLARCEKKRPWVKYNACRSAYLAARQEKDARRAALVDAERAEAPLATAVSSAEAQVLGLRQSLSHHGRPSAGRGHAGAGSVDDMLEALEEKGSAERDARRRVERVLAKTQQHHKEIGAEREKIADLEAQTRGPRPDTSAESQRLANALNDLRRPEADIDEQFEAAENRKRAIADEGHRLRTSIDSVSAEIAALKDARRQREEGLKRAMPEAIAARDVVSRMRSAGELRGTVYGPIALEIDVRDAALGTAVEALFGRPTLCTIVATRPDDHDALITRLVDERNLRVSVALFDGDASEIPCMPAALRQRVTALGFETTLLEAITAPDAVLAFLADSSRAHMVPIARGKVDQAAVERLADISRYVCYDGLYEIRRSLYNPEECAVRCSSVRGTGLVGVATEDDEDQAIGGQSSTVTALEARRLEIRHQLDQNQAVMLSEVQPLLERLRARRQELAEQRSQLTRQRRDALQAAAQYDAAVEQLRLARSRIRALQDAVRREEADLSSARQVLKACILERAALAVRAADALASTALPSACASAVDGLLLASAEARLASAKAALAETRAHNEDLREALARADAQVARCKEIAKDANLAARAANDGRELTPEESEALSDLPEDLDALDERSRQLRAQIAALTHAAGGTIGAHTVAQFDAREREIASLASAIDTDTQGLTALSSEIDAREAAWRPAIEALVSRIDERFAAHFARINCAGAVRLAPRHRAYARWELEILVRFRDGEPLAPLSAQRQSGGEKSVSTMLFLIALQQCAAAPFRLVDEINQGMDARNERSVHDILVAGHGNAAARTRSQYFVVTPKLLPDLTYDEHVHVMCVYNGEGVPLCA